MEKHQHLHRRELHLLPIPPPPETSPSRHRPPPKPTPPPSFDGPSLDLQLSITHGPYKPPPAPREPPANLGRRRAELLRWQAAEQMRLAATERACAERVRELTRRELELAQSELARARLLWDRTRDDVAKADRIKHTSIVQQVGVGSNNSMEIACHCCRRRFRP